MVLKVDGPAGGLSPARPDRDCICMNGDEMSVLVYIVLTVVIFGMLGLVQRWVEGL